MHAFLTQYLRDLGYKLNAHEHPDFAQVSSGVGSSTTLDVGTHVVSVTTSGLTITLPPAENDLVGMDWVVHLAVAGNVTIAPSAGDSIVLPTTDTTVMIVNKGDSLTFRCLNATTWAIV